MSEGSVARAYRELRAAIVEGQYRPGQRLVEQRIAEECELSRTPVREALRQLHAEGLVQMEPNRGSVVRMISVDDLVDLYELRSRLEAYAVERAAARITPPLLARLDAARQRFDAAVPLAATGSRDGVREVSRWNNEFHDTIVDASEDRRLGAVLARTVDHPLVFQAFRRFDDEQMSRSALFHHLIRDGIAQRDPRRAANLMSEHILQGRDVLLAALEQYESTDPLFDAIGN